VRWSGGDAYGLYAYEGQWAFAPYGEPPNFVEFQAWTTPAGSGQREFERGFYFPQMPELRSLWVRVRALTYPWEGAWSAPIEFRTGLRTPEAFGVSVTGTACRLGWDTSSTVAKSWLLERRGRFPAGGVAVDWTEIPTAEASQSVVEQLPPPGLDGAVLEYRLRARAGDVLSEPAVAVVGQMPLLAPANLAAVPTAAGMTVTWTNRSALASALVLRRSGGEAAAVEVELPPTATSYEDLGVVPGRYRYELLARLPGAFGPIESEKVAVYGETPMPAEWGPLVPSHIALPAQAAFFARGGDGWYGASSTRMPEELIALFAPTGSSWHRDDLPPKVGIPDGFHVDARGRVHVVRVDGDPFSAAPVPVVHAWWEAGAWQREVIAERLGPWVKVATVDPAGAVHVVIESTLADGNTGHEYGSNLGGAWELESLNAALGLRWIPSSMMLAAGGDGEVDLLMDWAGSMHLAIRTSTGWTVEQVPAGPSSEPICNSPDGLNCTRAASGVVRAAGRTLVLFGDQGRATTATSPLYALIRTGTADAGAWASRVVIAQVGVANRVALSATGRVAIATGSPRSGTAQVFVLEPGASAWTGPWRVFADTWGGSADLGFRSDGKLWMLDRRASGDPAPEGLRDHLLYEEQ
jgi:hypothetical protein